MEVDEEDAELQRALEMSMAPLSSAPSAATTGGCGEGGGAALGTLEAVPAVGTRPSYESLSSVSVSVPVNEDPDTVAALRKVVWGQLQPSDPAVDEVLRRWAQGFNFEAGATTCLAASSASLSFHVCCASLGWQKWSASRLSLLVPRVAKVDRLSFVTSSPGLACSTSPLAHVPAPFLLYTVRFCLPPASRNKARF
jgi:hypothetical protein